jgi:hypothetical protein
LIGALTLNHLIDEASMFSPGPVRSRHHVTGLVGTR